jgi:GR25 family glycosyltransferase involved in LPS biosynthesis
MAWANVGESMRIHLINLDRSADRLAEFRQVNGHLSDVIRFPAIDGSSLDRERLIQDGIIARDAPELAYTPGALGCAMSHLALWKVAANEARALTIAEDDAIFSYRFEVKAAALLAALGADWDIVLWGYPFQTFLWAEFLPGISGAEIRWDEPRLKKNLGLFQNTDVSPALIKLIHGFGTQCYSVSARGARALLEFCLPLTPWSINFTHYPIMISNVGIDCIMNGAYPTLQAFVCIPPLVVTEHVRSTIR